MQSTLVTWQAQKSRNGTVKKAKKVKRQPYYCEVRGSWIIPLTQGRETLVDEEDVEFLGQFNWHWNSRPTGTGYAVLKSPFFFRMHRVLTKCPDEYMVDHINGNSLDNRKSNLRIVTNRENQQNQNIHRSGRLCGCYYRKDRKNWYSRIHVDGTRKHLGCFKTEYEAHQAYMNAYNELITKEKSAA